MLICILGVYLLAVWVPFYRLEVATLDLKAKVIVFALGVGIVATVFFLAQRFAPFTKDVYVQSNPTLIRPMWGELRSSSRATRVRSRN